MKTAYINAKIYNTEKKCFEDGTLFVEDGIISAPFDADKTVDLGGACVMPGLVDVHTHGRIAIDADDADADKMCEMAMSYAKAGTTSFMPTFATVPFDWYSRAIDNIVEAKARQDKAPCGANILGIHFEGRYINVKKKGAHDPSLLAPLSTDELLGHIERMRNGDSTLKHFHITCAPELDGGEEFIRRAVSMGATVAIGHSAATYEQCMEAMKWGAKAFTHLYNAMSAMTHREPGCVGTGLSTEAYTELICDGYHVDPTVVKVTYRSKASDKLVLITDSLPAAGMAPGVYKMGDGICDTRNGKVGLCADGVTIYGSTIDLFTGMKNFMSFTGITLEEAIPYATINPAKMIDADDVVGSLEIGRFADFIVLDDAQAIADVYVRGEKQ